MCPKVGFCLRVSGFCTCDVRRSQLNPVLDVSHSVVSNTNPVISDPFATFPHVTSAVETVEIQLAHPLGRVINMVVVPKNRFTFFGFGYNFGLVAVPGEITHVFSVSHPLLMRAERQRLACERLYHRPIRNMAAAS